jgi:eukaryotic-like serine/threonine-protein kinase
MLAGRYRLEAALGTQSPASVWAATHLPSGRKVAIRRLPTAAGLPPQVLAPLVAELHDAVVVDHPSSARVFEVVEGVADAPLVVSELLRGETLAQLLAQRPQLSAREVASLLLPVVSAVGTAHARGIVHGRLSASSVFICNESGAQDAVKVLDFGLAKWAAAAQRAPQSSRSGALVPVQRGSAYAPPEQAIVGRAIDHRADTWALGIILYQCLSGLDVEAFVPRQDPLTLVLEPFVPIEQRTPGLPAELADIIAHLLVADPDHRAQNVIELFRVLSPLADRPSPSFGWPGSERRITVLTQRAVTVAPPAPAQPVIVHRRPVNWRTLALSASAFAVLELIVIAGLLVRERDDSPRVLQVVDATPARAETLALRAAAPRLALDDFEDGDGVPLAPLFGNWQSFTVNPAGRALELKLGEGHESGGSAEMSFLLERLAGSKVGRAGAGLRTSAREGSVDLSQFARLSFAHRHASMSTPGLECQGTSEFVVFLTCRALGQERVPQFEHSVSSSESWALVSIDLRDLREVGAALPRATNLKACLGAVDSFGFRADVSPNTETGGCDSGMLWVDDITFQ